VQIINYYGGNMLFEDENYKINYFTSDKQGDERFEVFIKANNEKKLLNIWDYNGLYSDPYLFEIIYQKICKSNSIFKVWDVFLSRELIKDKYRILDVGAGSGLSGKYIKEKSNPEMLIALDILPSAKTAYLRDYNHIYDEYLVFDLANLSNDQISYLKNKDFNCITAVSSSGGSDDDQDDHDVEINEYKSLLKIIKIGGYIVFNIREKEVTGQTMIRNYLEKYCETICSEIYPHRFLFNGSIVNNKVLVYQKMKNE
jgi:SAM-dependent methyltransferase